MDKKIIDSYEALREVKAENSMSLGHISDKLKTIAFFRKGLNENLVDLYNDYSDKVKKFGRNTNSFYYEDAQELMLEAYVLNQAIEQTLIMPHGEIYIDDDGNAYTVSGNIIVSRNKKEDKPSIKVKRK